MIFRRKQLIYETVHDVKMMKSRVTRRNKYTELVKTKRFKKWFIKHSGIDADTFLFKTYD